MSRGIRIALSVVITVALLAIGGVAIVTAPSDDDLVAPVPVVGTLGHTVQSREFVVRVSSAHLARTLHIAELDPQPGSATSGVWVVVDLTVTSRISPSSVLWSTLQIGDTLFDSESTVRGTLGIENLNAGVPLHGSLAFEISKAALASPDAGAARLAVRYSPTDFIDTEPVIVLDLSALSVQPSATVLQAVVPDRSAP